MLSIIWPRSLGPWQSFHRSVPSPIPVAFSLLWSDLSRFSPDISFPVMNSSSTFLSWMNDTIFFRICAYITVIGKPSYSCEMILFPDLSVQLCLLTAQNFLFLKQNYIGNCLLEVMQLKKFIYLSFDIFNVLIEVKLQQCLIPFLPQVLPSYPHGTPHISPPNWYPQYCFCFLCF